MEKKIKLKKISIKKSTNTEKKITSKIKNTATSLYSKVNSISIIVFSVCIVLLVFVIAYLNTKTENKYVATNGVIEQKAIVPNCYIVKEESLIHKDESKVFLPIMSDSSRVQKGAIIATYKGGEYENYEEKLLELDNEILAAMKQLPEVFSTEIESIDRQISNELLLANKETSYVKMQNSKKTINSLLNKKAILVADLSPAGSEIRQLISKRNKYVESSKASNDNILASTSGVVSYTTDGLEELLKVADIDKLTYDGVNETITKNGIIQTSNIKITNNYKAYIFMKVDKKFEEYIQDGKSYTLRAIADNNYEYSGTLVRSNISTDEKSYELVFKITNGIEELADVRKTEFEVVFKTTRGILVNKKSIGENANAAYSYITAIRYKEYVDIPVHISTQNEDYAIVTSYTEDELEQMNINKNYVLRLYENILEKAR